LIQCNINLLLNTIKTYFKNVIVHIKNVIVHIKNVIVHIKNVIVHIKNVIVEDIISIKNKYLAVPKTIKIIKILKRANAFEKKDIFLFFASLFLKKLKDKKQFDLPPTKLII
jgi:Tfp pilus assembly PilM family ATPase